MGERQIVNTVGAFGYSDLTTNVWNLQAPFEASATIVAKNVVSIGTDGRVAASATNGTASLAIGVAAEAASSGDSTMVTIMGLAEDVPATGAVAAGDLVKRSATTAGSVAATATPAIGEVLGVAINASASNVVDVWISKGLALS